MGICICHNAKNGLITSEVMLPAVINNTINDKEQNESIKTIPRIVQEKKLTKNLIRFSLVNTHASLSSILHDVNHEIMERTNHDKSKSKLTFRIRRVSVYSVALRRSLLFLVSSKVGASSKNLFSSTGHFLPPSVSRNIHLYASICIKLSNDVCPRGQTS